MARSVRLSDEAYQALLASMHEGESEAEAIRRLARPRAPSATLSDLGIHVPRPPTTLPLGWVTEIDRPKE